MSLFVRRLVVILLLMPLAFVLVSRGIVPAMSAIDTDFPNYFTAAKIVADGEDVSRLYDNTWFQDRIRYYGIQDAPAGKFAPFPPPTALLLIPLTRLQPLDALRVLTCVSLACLLGSVVLLSRILSRSLLETSVFVLLSGYAVLNALRFGQPYIVVSTSCIAGYYARLKGRPWIAGVCFGLFAPIKYFPIIFLAYFAFRKEWKIVLGGAAAVLVIGSVSIGVMGWEVHRQFLSSVLGDHLVANLSLQNPFAASFQSVDTLLRRLFVLDAEWNPRPYLDAPQLQQFGVPIIKVLVSILVITTLVSAARKAPAASVAPSLGILGVATLLLAPATATYHCVLLWLPVGLLLEYLLRAGSRAQACVVLGAYGLIGFFPYKYAYPFEGRGGLTVLAYPRLFLLLAIGVVGLHALWFRSERTAGTGVLDA